MEYTDQRPPAPINKYVRIPVNEVFLLADLQVPEDASAVVLFAHDGRCRNHPRNRHVAQILREKGLGTLLCDLITDDEAAEDEATSKYRNDAALLAGRLVGVTRWVAANPETKNLRVGYLGACAGAKAAVIAAADMPDKIGAIVARGAMLEAATKTLPRVTCPALLIVGGDDTEGIDLNREALPLLGGEKDLVVVPGASHLFGEPGKIKTMARLSADWFRLHLRDPAPLA
ncbi:MAG: dienelactone hydrolase family protein [Luteolibacter sp.]|jgi:dienelactone hydrolase|nr:dienelactone hydrolase family protein [Luteolibacter sp.]